MYVQVAVARPFTGLLSYAVPAGLQLRRGHVVLVPLGRVAETGYVVDTADTVDFDPSKVKPVSRLLDPYPAFDDVQYAFFRWIADYYKVPLGMVIQTALPSQIRAKVMRVLHPTTEGIEGISRREIGGDAALLLREVIRRPGLTRRGLVRKLAQELDKKAVERSIDGLIRHGYAAWEDKEVGGPKGKVATVSRTSAERGRLGGRQVELLERLEEGGGEMDRSELLDGQPSSAGSSLKGLEEKGLVTFGEREERDLLDDAPALGSATPPDLNAHQRAALDVLTADDADGAYLLYGVTGAGKTEVFLGAAAATLARGRQVLVLVPEIGLTPQLVGRFKARFGQAVAVLHSGLTGAQRLAAWRRIRAGEAQLAVGARSALFAPFQDLGLVVVDEEHDDSYKQDDGVPYSARDLAVVCGKLRSCPVVLASATPSLESWHNARSGRYTLLRLPERATARPVPLVEVVDISGPKPDDGPRPLLAPEVEQALRDTFARGGQAIVLYNRRGYATVVTCTACGASYECPNCGVAMTLHRQAARVTCHYCALSLRYDGACPVCHAPEMEEGGKGTEQVEERLERLFPEIAIARMDADTTSARGAHHRILTAFREGKTQLLVGTQIVAKGHDFPGVHTAVVISADRGFRMPDFRAAERTFALLVQVAGRAGRGDVPGRVFVQTYKPDHYVLQHLDDPEGFVDVELRLRATLGYPPTTRMCLIRLDGVNRRAVLAAAEELGRDLRAAARRLPENVKVGVLGPAPAAMPRLVGRWRFQLVLRGGGAGPLQRFLAAHLDRLKQAGKKGVRVAWDVDPRHVM